MLFASPILGLEWISWSDTGTLEGFLMPGWAMMPVVAFATGSLVWGLLVLLFGSRSTLLGAFAGVASAALTLSVPTRHVGRLMALGPYDGEAGWGVAVGVYSLVMYWIMGPLGSGPGRGRHESATRQAREAR
jgi:hypothetical protein